MANLGGVKDVNANANSLDIEGLAKFAVDDHNEKNKKSTPNAVDLQFVKVIKAKQQVVAGTVHYITLEAAVGTDKKVYEAEVWEKPWLNFKEVKGFKLAADGASSA